MSALMTEEYLEIRAARGTRQKFVTALSKVADIEPEERDRVLAQSVRRRRQKTD
jgi:hypothetical protein